MRDRSMSMLVRVAVATLLFAAVAIAGCMPGERRPGVARAEARSSAADVSPATTECEAFACQP
jgi:hypothetical protein